MTADIRQRNSDPGRIRFGVICRLTEQKGISYLLEALRMFRDRHGDVWFLFAGQGDCEETIRRFVDSERLANVRIARVVNARETLREIDVFVHPSIQDAMPMSIAEALMCGIPCVASRVGGIPDLVRDGVEGFLIEPRRTDQILDAMERFAAMPADEFEGFRKRARSRYEEVCTPEKVAAVVAARYAEVLSMVR